MNKNKIENTQQNTLLQKLIHQKNKDIPVKLPYIRLGIFLCFILAWVLIPVMWFFWLFWLFLWSIVLRFHIKKRKEKTKYKLRIKDFYCKERFRVEIQKKYPHLSSEQIDLLTIGFKDFLLISLMSPIYTAMPSNAVNDIWSIFFEEENNHICQTKYLIGSELKRRRQKIIIFECEGYKLLDDKRKFMERNITWKLACQLDGLNPLKTLILPRLYQIDQALDWQPDQQYDVEKLKQDYALYKKHYNNYEDLEYFIEHEIPHLGIRAHIPNDDST